jgi:uncharacterized protein
MDEGARVPIRVAVVFAEASRIHRFEVELSAGARVADALAACPGLDSIDALRTLVAAARQGASAAPDDSPAVGVFGQRRGLDFVLSDGDRVELCRDLVADPKQARRRRAAAAGP